MYSLLAFNIKQQKKSLLFIYGFGEIRIEQKTKNKSDDNQFMCCFCLKKIFVSQTQSESSANPFIRF